MITPVLGVGRGGPACFFVQTRDVRLLLDFGAGPGLSRLTDLSSVHPLHAIILSHAHPDHVDGLTLLPELPVGEIWATSLTWGALDADLLEAIDKSGALRRILPPRGVVSIAGIRTETGRTGHAPGGVWLHFEIGAGLLYLPDILPDAAFYAFDEPTPAGLVIADATYGDADVPRSRALEEIAVAAETGQPLLMPSPPLGRGPELAHALTQLGLQVALDAETRSSLRATLTAQPGDLWLREDVLVTAAEIAADAPLVGGGDAAPNLPIIAADGRAETGVAALLLDRLLAADAARPPVIFTGLLPETGRGAQLVAEGRALQVRWPGHPGFTQQQALLERLQPERTLLAFASPAEAERLARRLRAYGPITEAEQTPL